MLSESAADGLTGSAHLAPPEARRRLERERAARQAQLRSLDDADTGAGAEAGFLTVQRTAAEDVLAEVEAALARLEQGNYGSCEGCAEAIPAERLEALPHARRCIGCQRRAG